MESTANNRRSLGLQLDISSIVATQKPQEEPEEENDDVFNERGGELEETRSDET